MVQCLALLLLSKEVLGLIPAPFLGEVCMCSQLRPQFKHMHTRLTGDLKFPAGECEHLYVCLFVSNR